MKTIKTGKEIVPCKYSRIEPFSEGLAAVGINCKEHQEIGRNGDFLWHMGTYGFIDKQGNEVIPCKYNLKFADPLEVIIEYFKDGIIYVIKDGNEFYIDRTGKEYIKE